MAEFPGHTHTPQPDSQGRQICSTCQSMVLNTITSSDDPRLVNAGLMRTRSREVTSVDSVDNWLPLPELLISLYYNAEVIGLINAPVAWYVDRIANIVGDRAILTGQSEANMWNDIHKDWETKWIHRNT